MRVGISSATLRWLALHEAGDGRAAVHIDDDGLTLERDGTRIRWSELRSVTLGEGCHLVDDAGREIRLSPALDHYSELVTHVFRHAAHRRASTASLPHVIHLPRRATDRILVVLFGLPGFFASSIFALTHSPRTGVALALATLLWMAWAAAAPLTRVAWAPGYALMPWMFASAVAAPWLAHDLVRAERRRITALLGMSAGAFLLVGRHAHVTLMIAALVAIAISLLPLAGARRTPLRPHAALAHYAAMLCVAVYVASTSSVWLPAVVLAVAVMPVVVLSGRGPTSPDSRASGLSSRVRHPDEDGATVSPL